MVNSIDYKHNICYFNNQHQLYLLITTGLFYFIRGHTHAILQLVWACSISQGAIQCLPAISTGLFYFSKGHTMPSCNQYRPVLFHQRSCICHSTISTGLFYFSKDHAIPFLQLVQSCSIFQEAMHMPLYNQYRPVLFHKRPYICHSTISTGLFYSIRGSTHTILQLVQACSIS